MAGKPVHRPRILTNKITGGLCKFEYFAERKPIVPEDLFMGARIRNDNLQIDKHCVPGTPPRLVEGNRHSRVLQNFAGDHDVSTIARYNIVMRPPDQFLPHRFREPLLDTIGGRPVQKGRNGDTLAPATIKILARQTEPASRQSQKRKTHKKHKKIRKNLLCLLWPFFSF